MAECESSRTSEHSRGRTAKQRAGHAAAVEQRSSAGTPAQQAARGESGLVARVLAVVLAAAPVLVLVLVPLSPAPLSPPPLLLLLLLLPEEPVKRMPVVAAC